MAEGQQRTMPNCSEMGDRADGGRAKQSPSPKDRTAGMTRKHGHSQQAPGMPGGDAVPNARPQAQQETGGTATQSGTWEAGSGRNPMKKAHPQGKPAQLPEATHGGQLERSTRDGEAARQAGQVVTLTPCQENERKINPREHKSESDQSSVGSQGSAASGKNKRPQNPRRTLGSPSTLEVGGGEEEANYARDSSESQEVADGEQRDLPEQERRTRSPTARGKERTPRPSPRRSRSPKREPRGRPTPDRSSSRSRGRKRRRRDPCRERMRGSKRGRSQRSSSRPRHARPRRARQARPRHPSQEGSPPFQVATQGAALGAARRAGKREQGGSDGEPIIARRRPQGGNRRPWSHWHGG